MLWIIADMYQQKYISALIYLVKFDKYSFWSGHLIIYYKIFKNGN